MNDEQLVADYYGCNNDSMAELITRHSNNLVGWFVNRGIFQDEAEDRTQDVWVRLMNTKQHLWGSTASPFNPVQGEFRGWLWAIAWNLLRDARRQQAGAPGQLPASEDEGFEQEIPAPQEPVGADLVAGEVSEAFQAAYQECLDGLPAHYRDVLLLELERLELDPVPEQAQWAANHEFTFGQYTSRLHRTREQMRECMQKRLQDDLTL
jgi:RNA polymerase sigma factor (sigma-70 family)